MQRDMDNIRAKITRMMELAVQALNDALTAVVQGNRPMAYRVILRDQFIDQLEKELDRLCLEFLVRQQPVAAHLRFVYAAIKLNQELERIGDYAESVARQALKLVPPPLPHIVADRVREISKISIPMLQDAVRAFLTQDLELAEQTMQAEITVDNLRTTINKELIHLREGNQLPLEALLALLTIVRRYERVSDQAKNICEEVVYLCTGEYAKHQGVEQFRVLFLDEDNATLSQMAEGVGNALGQTKFVFSSAGTEIKPVNERVVEFLGDKGIDISMQRPKALSQVPHLDSYQVVVVFHPRLKPLLRPFAPKAVVLDWSPVAEEIGPGSQGNFEKVYEYLDLHVRDLVQAILGYSLEPENEHEIEPQTH